MGDKAYSPNPVEVKVGGGVTWSNDDTQIHTATSGISPINGTADTGPDGVFDSGVMTPGATFDFVFDTAGTRLLLHLASTDDRNCHCFRIAFYEWNNPR